MATVPEARFDAFKAVRLEPSPLNVPLLKLPPVTVLPVKVSAVGRLIVGFPEVPAPSATAISLAVPVSVLEAAVPIVISVVYNYLQLLVSLVQLNQHLITEQEKKQYHRDMIEKLPLLVLLEKKQKN